MTERSDRPRPTRKLIALAALAGLAAGAVAVYVTGMPSGNRLAEAACPAQEQLARAVDELAVGEIAALAAADPVGLGGLAFTGPDGEPLTLAGFAGRIVLVNLWATWCAPCRAEMPALDRLQQRLGGEAFEVVAINVEKGSDDKPKGFLREIDVSSLAFYRDETLGVFNELRRRSLALGLPVTLLVDGDGCLVASMNGPAEWDSDDAVRLVGELLRRHRAARTTES